MITVSIIIIGIAAFLGYCVKRYELKKKEIKKQHLYRQWESHWRNASAELLTPRLKTQSEVLSDPNTGDEVPTRPLVTLDTISRLIESSALSGRNRNNAEEVNRLRKLAIIALAHHWIFRFYNEGDFPPDATSTAYEAMLNQLSLQELISEARHHQDDLELCEYIHFWFNRI